MDDELHRPERVVSPFASGVRPGAGFWAGRAKKFEEDQVQGINECPCRLGVLSQRRLRDASKTWIEELSAELLAAKSRSVTPYQKSGRGQGAQWKIGERIASASGLRGEVTRRPCGD